MIYLDYNATTPVLPEVLAAMAPYWAGHFGNPASLHEAGRAALAAVGLARDQVAALVGASSSEVIFTSSATEANNTAIGAALAADAVRPRLVVGATEHSSVLSYAAVIARRGVEVVIVPVHRNGLLDVEALAQAIQPGTALVSVMWANNETGVVHPIEAVAGLCAERGVPLHCDAVQAAGRWPIDLHRRPVAYLTLSSHTIFGPKGAGALLVRPGAPFGPLLVGGHQESGRRAGTENVPAVVGFGAAAALAGNQQPSRARATMPLRDALEDALVADLPGVCVHGAGAPRLPNTSNLGFSGIDAEALVRLLDDAGVCVSAGSACLAHTLTPSHVVQAMTGSYAQAGEALRFSLSHLTTREEVQHTVEVVKAKVRALRGW